MTEGIEDDERHWVSKGGRGDRLSPSGGVRGDSQGVQEVAITLPPAHLTVFLIYGHKQCKEL